MIDARLMRLGLLVGVPTAGTALVYGPNTGYGHPVLLGRIDTSTSAVKLLSIASMDSVAQVVTDGTRAWVLENRGNSTGTLLRVSVPP